MEGERVALLRKLIDFTREISAISSYRCVARGQCRNLSRRLKLLAPLIEEFTEIGEKNSGEVVIEGLVLLKEALESAKELLGVCSRGSKIFLVLQSKKIWDAIQEVSIQFDQALSIISYDKLDIPDELKEQVELVHNQFAKSKRTEVPNLELYEDMLSICNQNMDVDTDPCTVGVLCEKLELMSIEQLQEETIAMNQMVATMGWDVEQSRDKISVLLKKFEDYVRVNNPTISVPSCGACLSNDQECTNQSPKSPVVPDDFRCPISLQLMKDPVIICTGQTYDRACIKRWLEAGHKTCPKTQQKLFSSTLTPNFALSSVITNWCEANGMEPPSDLGNSLPGRTSVCSVEGVDINALMTKLSSANIEDQRAASGELRLLAKNHGNNRKLIAEAGAIPLLVCLLFSSDTITQEHVITALLNLSILEDNKRSIASSEAVPGILHVLQNGSMKARENAAATIFSLTVIDECKMTIGALGAIPVLIMLLREGSQQGKKDAAAALFNLCVYRGNKARAIKAGAVPLLMTMLTELGGEMVDEALAIIAMLASHPEGKGAIEAFKALPVLVDLIQSGSPKNKENATAVMVNLCAGNHQLLSEALALGVLNPLVDLEMNGTERGKRKARLLLELLGDTSGQVQEFQGQAEGCTIV